RHFAAIGGRPDGRDGGIVDPALLTQTCRRTSLHLDVGRPNDLTPSAGPVDYDLAVRGNNHAMILR
ncbi:MAG: hypothetical protein ACXU87_15800, partial [Xanthobacteraceae bacterium]